MTRRERLERKVEKRRDWAESRDKTARAKLDAAHQIADNIPLGQPLMPGHHSYKRALRDRDRIENNTAKGMESLKMAERHRSKAAGLADQLENSIYSDDPDALEALQAKIAGLEADRDRMKAINKEIKKGPGWEIRLHEAGIEVTDNEKKILLDIAKFTPYHCDKKTGLPVFPGYTFTNMGGNIRRLQERMTAVAERQRRTTAAAATPDGVLIEGEAHVRVTFAEKPARLVLDALKAADFRWSGGYWFGERARLPVTVSGITEADCTLDSAGTCLFHHVSHREEQG